MPKFILLTDCEDDHAVVNVSEIRAVVRMSDSRHETKVIFINTDKYLYVKETPDEIYDMIRPGKDGGC